MNPNQYYGAEPNPGNSAPLMATFTQKEIYNLVEKYFVDFKDSYPIDAKPVFIYQSVPMQNGIIKRFDEKDFSTYAKTKPEGALTKRAKYGIGYHKDVLMKTVGLEMALTEESIKFNKWDDVKEIGVELGKTVPNRMNLDMTHFAFTFAQSTSYVDMDGFTIDETTGDGVALASASHTLAHSALTYTNIIPGAPQFSKSALISAEIIARNNTLDNYGIPKSMKFSHIWTTGNPNTVENVLQFLKSISDNTQANPNVENTYKNRYKLLVLEQIDTDVFGQRDTTKSNWWGTGAFEGDVKGKRFTAIYAEWEAAHMKPAPTSDNNANDFSRDIQKYGTRGRYNVCALNGMGITYSFAV
jgi:hypothetical protein